MGFYETYLLPRMISFALSNKEISREREKTVAGVSGRVLEIGFGSGLNLPYYSDAVEQVVGVDPSTEGAKLAQKRIAEVKFPVEHVALAGEELQVEPGSFDAAVSTLTLCTIPDALTALKQVRRALKPGGKLYFLEHGRAVEPSVIKWQDRWQPIHGWLFGGCHVDRKIDQLVIDAGFTLDALENYYIGGPKLLSYMYRGVARST